jgi:hypothetical protein
VGRVGRGWKYKKGEPDTDASSLPSKEPEYFGV